MGGDSPVYSEKIILEVPVRLSFHWLPLFLGIEYNKVLDIHDVKTLLDTLSYFF